MLVSSIGDYNNLVEKYIGFKMIKDKTEEEFNRIVNKIKEFDSLEKRRHRRHLDYSIMTYSTYTNINDDFTFKCAACGESFVSTYYKVLKGKKCTNRQCSANLRKTPAEIDKMMRGFAKFDREEGKRHFDYSNIVFVTMDHIMDVPCLTCGKVNKVSFKQLKLKIRCSNPKCPDLAVPDRRERYIQNHKKKKAEEKKISVAKNKKKRQEKYQKESQEKLNQVIEEKINEEKLREEKEEKQQKEI